LRAKKGLITTIILALAALIFYFSKPISLFWNSPGETATETIAVNDDAKESARIQAQALLAQALSLSDEIRRLNPDKWAKTTFFEIEEDIAKGEKNYRRGAYRSAKRNYRQAIRNTEELIRTIPMVIEKHNLAGDLAILNKDAIEAKFSYSLSLEIEPTNEHATKGLARSNSLDKVSALITEGAHYETLGKLDTAIVKYKAAETLDPGNPALESAKQRIKFEQRQQNYLENMSRGFSALKTQAFSDAKVLFETAQKYNNSSEVKQALRQADNGLVNIELKNLIGKGHDASTNESWKQAATFYKRAVARDSGLADIVTLSANAKARWALDERIEHCLSLPLGISLSDEYDSAIATLHHAEAIPVQGSRLSHQIVRLKHAIELAQTPVDVIINSDNVTSVKIRPNSDLGRFKRIKLGLLPGEYLIENHCDNYGHFTQKAIVSHMFSQKEQELTAECSNNAAK